MSTRERELLAKAYQDNGDYGSASMLRNGSDPTPDTQISLLAIKDALASHQKVKCRYCGGAGKFQVVSPVSDHAWATCFCQRTATTPARNTSQIGEG